MRFILTGIDILVRTLIILIMLFVLGENWAAEPGDLTVIALLGIVWIFIPLIDILIKQNEIERRKKWKKINT